MEEPDFLPTNLKKYASCASDRQLFQSLSPRLDDLISYFETGCDDVTWANRHRKFLALVLRWCSRNYFSNRLPRHKAMVIVAIIRKYYALLAPELLFFPSFYYTIKIKAFDEVHDVNCLLFGVESDYFRNLFRSSFENFTYFCQIKSGNLFQFLLVKEYLNTGDIGELWRLDFDQLKALMRLARIWFLPGLLEKCSEIIKRYIDRDNVVATILEAHRLQYLSWKNEAFQFFNDHEKGLQFIPADNESELRIQVLDLKHDTINCFNQFASEVTHLSMDVDLALEPAGKDLIDSCPRLKGFDMSGSRTPLQNFGFLPSNLIELNLSACTWIHGNHIRVIAQNFLYVKKLELAGNVQLGFSAWSELSRMHHLTFLNLSGCHQLKREDLVLIARSTPNLLELSLEECRQLADPEFIDFITLCPHLRVLNLSGCSGLSDRSLNELGLRAYQLSYLICVRTTGFTDQGIERFVRMRSSLLKLNLRSNPYSVRVIANLKQEFPFLQIEN